ncbi:hypothetical protein [Sulfitobacter geojensis]|jgi:hypothetical protein|uniref:Uncharacterized protein n=1 Tax=Sulfitobacter geojensis TaxID=1342299 RepID=A0AAE2VUS7_9RHOB|nr:hypothetical protein [Sulfitobacter geojensis]KHA52901.1 putative lipoprotein [Sulfitobacter geojensis]MBM1687771.1 hypothetical protein [Sulfitobacter geojensis]MBM1691838.1 hypothetical protein [Sulfitobacter geojensis]MBM1704004.1 hypothetical protein [Sulfitobacter geojensis]MBM1708062.1 hypothetical protein [Sulfitobacter geojensis]
MKRALPLCLTAALLTGCTQFPELDRTQSATLEAADYPALVPIEPLLARAAATTTDPVQTEGNLNSRLAGLRARANAMRGAVLSDAEKRRLESGRR